MKNKIDIEKLMTEFRKWEKIARQPNAKSHEILRGNSPIMFSAPHNVPHIRNGKLRKREPQTGPICKALNVYKKCPVIIKTANLNDDANFDKECSYKEDLKTYIEKHNVKMLIDIHQMSYRRRTMINIGAGGFKNIDNMDILHYFISVFSSYKFGKIQIDTPFGAKGENTNCSYIARECNIPCVQLEINSRLLKKTFKEECLEDFLKSIFELTEKLTNYFKRPKKSPIIIAK